MKVGDEIWMFDENRRVYKKGNNHPIFSEHFFKIKIDGETSKSWLIGGKKFSKKNPVGIYTYEQKEDKIWDRENRHEIIEKIRFCSINELKQIYSIVNSNSSKT